MKVTRFAIPIVIIIVAIYAVPRICRSTVIEQNGDKLSITVGKHQLTADVISNQTTDSFLVVGGSYSGDLYFNSLLSVVPLDTAERLYRRYGNFRRCGSPGASEGMQSVIPVLLYADNYSVERTLKKVDGLAAANKDPVVKMTFVQINITDHKISHGGQPVQVTSYGIDDAFLVKDIQIIEKECQY